jgi:hypothetical protein
MIQIIIIIGTSLIITYLMGIVVGIVVFGAFLLYKIKPLYFSGQVKGLYTKIKKHFTLTNLILGLVSIVIAAFIKEFGLAQFIANYFGIYNSVFSECLAAGSLGLIVRLGLRGLIEELLECTTPQTMADGGGNSESMNFKNKSGIHYSEPPVPSSSNPAGASGPAVPASSDPARASGPAVPASSDPARASSYTPGYGPRRLAYVLNLRVEDTSTKISSLSAKIASSSDPSAKAQMEEELSDLFEELSFFSSEAAEATSKGLASEQGLSSKRDLNPSEDEKSSNKRR